VSRVFGFLLGAALALQIGPGHGSPVFGADVKEAGGLYQTGDYAGAAKAAAEAIASDPAAEEWHLLRLRALLAVGDHEGASATLAAALEALPFSIRLRWEGRPALLHAGRLSDAEKALAEIGGLLRRSSYRYGEPADRVVIGRYLLATGTDPRRVLEGVYDRVKAAAPEAVEPYVASGDLALEKHDAGIAVQEFEKAKALAPGDPDILVRLARARAASDAAAGEKEAHAALERNPRHVESLLFLADGAIDREAYGAAKEIVDRALDVHPSHPEAFAYRAVLAHLAGDYEGEKAARAAALRTWAGNPSVDHTIGRKLSGKYRFEDGAAYQRAALSLEANHLPALTQLSQDLLRLGREEEGWRLAREVFEKDPYSVVAHNLDILREHLAGFRTLEAEGLILRMHPREADIYGARALDLLARARETLSARYEVDLGEPVIVEVFPEQKDFAIRTFGLPGGAGFLGVCFGHVITANSPASQGESPSNWEAVLWHELCHAVTLKKTRNRMPRWLSEGISVWEERRANPVWGQSMTPAYLEVIEKGGLKPASQLSAAFLQPESPLHLQFAYYESALVVEFLVETRGLDALKRILDGLGRGVPIDRVLVSEAGPLADLDRDAEAFIRARAGALAARADWEKPDLPRGADLETVAAWTREHPRNYRGLQLYAAALAAERRWEEAREVLGKLIDMCPEYAGPDSAHELLARVAREQSLHDVERAALERLAALDADCAPALLRLLEISKEAKDWAAVAANAERLLAVNPLIKEPHRHLAEASEALGAAPAAIRAYRSLLAMEPVDPAGARFRLARLLRAEGDLDEARRELVMALEDAPRFLAAHRELLGVVRELEARSAAENAVPGTKF
jgi:tetratricopeptide (TPR) repeat protein